MADTPATSISDLYVWVIDYNAVIGSLTAKLCTSVSDVVAHLKTLIETAHPNDKVRVVCRGEEWSITKGPRKYLISGSGVKIPLFDADAPPEIDPSGTLLE